MRPQDETGLVRARRGLQRSGRGSARVIELRRRRREPDGFGRVWAGLCQGHQAQGTAWRKQGNAWRLRRGAKRPQGAMTSPFLLGY